ncbi:MAG: hypothetical protein DCF31_09145, partial [Alphaproteobacteria bacterium]
GWHSVTSAGKTWPFPVGTPSRALVAAETRAATLQLQAQPAASRTVSPDPGARGPSWPWFAAWLLVSTLLWWLERRRNRRTPGADVSADI